MVRKIVKAYDAYEEKLKDQKKIPKIKRVSEQKESGVIVMKPDNELANTIVQKKQNGSLILINLLQLLSVAIIVLLGMINDNDIIGIMKVSIMAFCYPLQWYSLSECRKPF